MNPINFFSYFYYRGWHWSPLARNRPSSLRCSRSQKLFRRRLSPLTPELVEYCRDISSMANRVLKHQLHPGNLLVTFTDGEVFVWCPGLSPQHHQQYEGLSQQRENRRLSAVYVWWFFVVGFVLCFCTHMVTSLKKDVASQRLFVLYHSDGVYVLFG